MTRTPRAGRAECHPVPDRVPGQATLPPRPSGQRCRRLLCLANATALVQSTPPASAPCPTAIQDRLHRRWRQQGQPQHWRDVGGSISSAWVASLMIAYGREREWRRYVEVGRCAHVRGLGSAAECAGFLRLFGRRGHSRVAVMSDGTGSTAASPNQQEIRLPSGGRTVPGPHAEGPASAGKAQSVRLEVDRLDQQLDNPGPLGRKQVLRQGPNAH